MRENTLQCILNFIVFMGIGKGAPNNKTQPNKLTDMVDTLVTSIYPKVNLTCTILLVVNTDIISHKDMLSSQQNKHPTIVITHNYITNNKEQLSSFLQQQIGCLVAAFAGGRNLLLEELVYVVRKVEKHVILKLDNIQPKFGSLVTSDYPIAWSDNIQKEGSDILFLNIYCPKEYKAKGTIMKFSFAKPDKIKCPHYLEGQELGLGHIPHSVKRMINGRPVYGDNYVRFFEYISKKFKFRPWFKMGRVMYFANNETWGGLQAQVIKGKLLMARGRVIKRHMIDMEISFPFKEQSFYFISRIPRVLENMNGFLLPFAPSIWILILFSLVCLSIMFYITHTLYASPELMNAGLHRPEICTTNFLIYTIGKITEPDPIPWFSNKWSTGKFLTFVWSLFSFLMVGFYNCNLRAHLSAVDFEKPIDTAEDVILHGKRPWLMTELEENQVSYLEKSGKTDTALYKIAKMSQKMNGFYSFTQHGGVSVEAIRDIVQNDAVAIFGDTVLREKVRLLPRYREARNGDMLYLSKERAFHMSFCMDMRKYIPVRAEINLAVLTAVELGLFSKWNQEGLPMEAFLDHDTLQTYDEKKPMHFQQVVLPLLFCLVGLMAAGLTIFWELRSSLYKHHSMEHVAWIKDIHLPTSLLNHKSVHHTWLNF